MEGFRWSLFFFGLLRAMIRRSAHTLIPREILGMPSSIPGDVNVSLVPGDLLLSIVFFIVESTARGVLNGTAWNTLWVVFHVEE